MQGPYAADNAMFFFYTSQLKLTPEFIGIKQFVDGIAILCGMRAIIYLCAQCNADVPLYAGCPHSMNCNPAGLPMCSYQVSVWHHSRQGML